jgi:hypothetical protein
MNILPCRVHLGIAAGPSPTGVVCDGRSVDEDIGSYNMSCLLSVGVVAQFSRPNFLGGVAERLNAPVLKTGRPKGLVSSNLTPSASLVNGRGNG